MKKIMFLSMLAAIMGLASCSSDDTVVDGSRTQTAQITLTLPDDIATVGNSSRADATADYVQSGKGGVTNLQGKNINFYVALYYGDKIVFHQQAPCTVGTGKPSVTFNPTVVMGEEYQIVAWAEFGDAVEKGESSFDLTKIKIEQALNDEAKDGYFCSEKQQAAQTMTATLKRPYGKLRLVAEDYAAMNNQTGKTVKSITVTYNTANPYASFDAKEGKFSGENTTKEYTADLKSYSKEEIATGNTVPTKQTLMTAYIPVAADGSTLVPFVIKVTYNDGTEFTRSFSDDIPVKRNYLTTLTGNFFTSTAKLTLIVDEAFGGTEEVKYKFVEDATTLTEALTKGENVMLSKDITLEDAGAIEPNSTIDLNGHTLTLATKSDQFYIANNKTCTFKNGTVSQKRSGNSATFYVTSGSSLVIENATITETGGGAAIFPQGDAANVTIKNSKITGEYFALSTNATNSYTCDIVIENSELSSKDAGIVVNVPVNFTMTNSKVTSIDQGVVIRGAKATIKDCTITLTPDETNIDNIDATSYLSKDWDSGNNVPAAAMVIGNRSGSYQYPTTVNLVNTKLVVSSTGSDYPCIYSYANTAADKGVTFTYDNDCTFTGGRTTKKVATETVWDSKSIILGTTANITINGKKASE